MVMKRALILGRTGVVEKNDSRQLATLLNTNSRTVRFDHAYLEDCVCVLGDRIAISTLVEGNSRSITGYDFVYILGWSGSRTLSDIAHTIANFAADNNVKVWNSELLHARSMTKLSQMYRAVRVGARIPTSVFSLNHDLLAKAVHDHLTTDSIIVKDIETSRGRRNELVARDDLSPILARYHGHPMIAQHAIPNDASDLRIIVVGGKTGLVFRREGQPGSHLTNTSQGGSARKIPLDSLPSELHAEVAALSHEFGREVCGIDYMFDTEKKQYIFLEINMTPQLVTGVSIDDKIATLREAINATLR